MRVELTCPVALDAGSTSTAACSEAVLATLPPRPFLFLLSPQIARSLLSDQLIQALLGLSERLVGCLLAAHDGGQGLIDRHHPISAVLAELKGIT